MPRQIEVEVFVENQTVMGIVHLNDPLSMRVKGNSAIIKDITYDLYITLWLTCEYGIFLGNTQTLDQKDATVFILEYKGGSLDKILRYGKE